jgi:hypothetical protein
MQARLLTPMLALVALYASCATATSNQAARLQQPTALDEPLRVLLLGDSISIGYTPFVQQALEGRAQVVRPTRGENSERPENCAGTNNGVEHLERWLTLEGGEWDVIHFNFGLHDLKRVHADTGKNSNDADAPHQASPERYEAQLRAIVTRLKTTGARLVFATTTPVPTGELRPYRAPADALEYNRIAVQVMADERVEVNDLFGFLMQREPSLLRPGDVHFSEVGSRELGERVALAILDVAGLPRRNSLCR